MIEPTRHDPAIDDLFYVLKQTQDPIIAHAIKSAIFRIHELQLALDLASADAERLATELESSLAGVYWEHAGESSPALITHKNRLRYA